MNCSISRLLFVRILVSHQRALIILTFQGVIANLNIVSGFKRQLHRGVTLIDGSPRGPWAAGAWAAGTWVGGVGYFRSGRWFWNGRRRSGRAAAPPAGANGVR